MQQMQQQSEAQRQQQAPAPAPPPPPQTQARNEPLLPLPEAPHPQQQSLPEMPTPQTRANSSANNDNQFSREISKAAHAAIQGNGSGRNYGSGPSASNKGVGSGMQILTDTQGVDFDPYMLRLKYIIEHAWQPLIPESVYPPLNKQGVVGIRFTIDKSGKLAGITLQTPSGDVALDKAAWGAIIGPQPFPPLPKEFPGKNIEIQGGFFYNENPDQ
jgi:TonB family protein